MKKSFIFCGLCISFLFFTGCQGQNKVNLADYLKVSFDGANGRGTVSAGLDEEKVMKDLYGEVAMTDPETFVMSLDEEKKRALKTQASSLKNAEIKINKKKDLSNGDKITVTVNARNVDEFVNGSKGFEVKGLKKVPKKIQDVSNFDELKKEMDDSFSDFYSKQDYTIHDECLMYKKDADSDGYGELVKVFNFSRNVDSNSYVYSGKAGSKSVEVISIDDIFINDDGSVNYSVCAPESKTDDYDSVVNTFQKKGYEKVE